MKTVIITISVALMLVVGACSPEPTKNTTTQQQDTSWYPLAVGNTWIYRFTRNDTTIVGYDTLRVTGIVNIKGVQYYISKLTRSYSTELLTSYIRLRGNDTLVSYRRPNNDSQKDSTESIDFVFSQDTSREYTSYAEQGGNTPRRTVSRNDTLTVNGVFYTNVLVLENDSHRGGDQLRYHFRRGAGMIHYLYLPSLSTRSVNYEISLVSFQSASNY